MPVWAGILIWRKQQSKSAAFLFTSVTSPKRIAVRDVIIFTQRTVVPMKIQFVGKGGVQMACDRKVQIPTQEAAHGEKT